MARTLRHANEEFDKIWKEFPDDDKPSRWVAYYIFLQGYNAGLNFTDETDNDDTAWFSANESEVPSPSEDDTIIATPEFRAEVEDSIRMRMKQMKVPDSEVDEMIDDLVDETLKNIK